jgi:hypothetical protein
MTRVFPGALSSVKMSSLLIASSPPVVKRGSKKEQQGGRLCRGKN